MHLHDLKTVLTIVDEEKTAFARMDAHNEIALGLHTTTLILIMHVVPN